VQKWRKHPLPYLSQSKNGKTNLIYLPKHLREKAKKWVENYKGAKNIIERLSEVNFEILKNKGNENSFSLSTYRHITSRRGYLSLL